MEEKKESNADIYAKVSTNKKLEAFANLQPMVVSVQDDVTRKRFHVTEYRGKYR